MIACVTEAGEDLSIFRQGLSPIQVWTMLKLMLVYIQWAEEWGMGKNGEGLSE